MTRIPSTALAVGLMLPALPYWVTLATTLFAVLAVVALRSRRLMDRALPVTIAALVAVSVGCGSQETPDTVATTGSDSIDAADHARRATGKARVEYVDGFVTVHSDGSLQIAILEQLAAQAGFAIVTGKINARSVTLQIERIPLLDAIAMILDGIEYTVEYAFDEASGTRFVSQIVIGDARASPSLEIERVPVPQADPAELAGEATSDEQAGMIAELDNPDPDARIDAVFWLDSDEQSINRMISMLQSDPDPEVRASIVDRLGDEESPAAIAAVTAALRDSDPEVVLRAIEVLEFDAGDWLIPELEQLLGHSNQEVREAAEDALTYLK